VKFLGSCFYAELSRKNRRFVPPRNLPSTPSFLTLSLCRPGGKGRVREADLR